MTKIQALMAKKVYGVPVYLVALLVGVAALYGAYRMRATPEVDPPTGDTADVSGDEADDSQPIFLARGLPSEPTPIPTPGVTNETWGKGAITFLVTAGNPFPESNAAITKFLAGDTLSFEQGILRDKALAGVGFPPEPVPVGKTQRYNGPASKQGTPPCAHTVKGTSDDTPNELSRLYYGIELAQTTNLIRAANSTVVEPYPIGTKLRIPKEPKHEYYRTTAAIRTLAAIAAKNSTTPRKVQELNPNKNFPVPPGTRVQVA